VDRFIIDSDGPYKEKSKLNLKVLVKTSKIRNNLSRQHDRKVLQSSFQFIANGYNMFSILENQNIT